MAERWELQPDGTWVNGSGTVVPHDTFPEPVEGQDAWEVNVAHLGPIYRYWVCYRDPEGEVVAGEYSFLYELDSGDNVRRAEVEMRLGADVDLTILTWKRLQ